MSNTKREIKFRAWDGKEMHYNVNILSRWGAIKEGYFATPYSDDAKAGEPMQYTGLKDRNGKEIYEGDIVKWGHIAGGLENPIRVAKVDLFPSLQFEIIQNRKRFYKRTFEYGSFMYQDTEKYLEVIGNIYENPELIK